ncbi:shikimate dehydrogenase [Fundidesulfovibrio butyratiphilus]
MPDRLCQSVRVPERLFGIIGHPLSHTLSPLLHNWGFAQRDVKAAYLAFPTPPERLGDLIAAVRALPISGLSVTIPHKEAVMPLLDEITEQARLAGAVNTLYWKDDKLVGDNTDVDGFLAPLAARPGPKSALVLGAGGAAKAVMAGLGMLGVSDVTVTNRHAPRAESLAKEFGARTLAWDDRLDARADLVVNTTPLGMSGSGQALSPFSGYAWTPDQIAYDLVYNPAVTVFLAEARKAGALGIGGLDMFVGQGAKQFRLWTGKDLPLDQAADLLRQALGIE